MSCDDPLTSTDHMKRISVTCMCLKSVRECDFGCDRMIRLVLYGGGKDAAEAYVGSFA